MINIKLRIRSIGLRLARAVGMNLRDSQTGAILGKALIIPWGGKLHVIGLDEPVKPVFLPQKRLTYWKQELGFTKHRAPDFSRQVRERGTIFIGEDSRLELIQKRALD